MSLIIGSMIGFLPVLSYINDDKLLIMSFLISLNIQLILRLLFIILVASFSISFNNSIFSCISTNPLEVILGETTNCLFLVSIFYHNL